MIALSKSPNGWTLDTLEKYLTEKVSALVSLSDERENRNTDKFNASKEAVSFALAAAEKAVIKAETAAEKRFESVNEFREQLKDQQATLLPRAEFQVQHDAVGDRIGVLERDAVAARGKSTGISSIGAVIIGAFIGLSALSSLAVVIIMLLRHL